MKEHFPPIHYQSLDKIAVPPKRKTIVTDTEVMMTLKSKDLSQAEIVNRITAKDEEAWK